MTIIFRFLLLLCVFLFSNHGFSATHLTLKGSLVNNNLGLNSQENFSGSASVAFDIGTYLRLGITHRRAESQIKGYRETSVTNEYRYEEERTDNIANSIDLTVILYYGRVFVPYIQLGMVRKEYTMTYMIENLSAIKKQYTLPAVPNAGIGLGIRLNSDFSLKLSYSVSQGIKQKRPDTPPEGVLDSYTSVGISYSI